jgi:glycosyltransferase involved in cell wall biosynthesis
VTEGSYQLYLNRYEFLETPDKFHFVPNGCDLNEYRSLNGRKRHIDPDRFVILSAASGYKKDYRDITPFFLAIQNFLTHQPSAKKKLEIIFLGKSLSKEYNSLLEQIGIIPYIRELDAVVREDFIQWLWRADLFFLVQPKNNKTSISGTLYEYWATGKAPTLLIAETGASTSLVENYSLGKAFHFKEVDGISNFINEVYTNLQNLQPMYISSDGIEFFDRKHLAQKMVNIWQDCLRDLHHG